MTSLADFNNIAAVDHHFCVMTTSRADGTMQASVVSAGVMRHPENGDDVVALVANGSTRKLANLRARPQCTIVASNGGPWAAVEGPAEIIGPDDPKPGVDADALRLLLREAFKGAGGSHDDWDEYDRVMAADRRAVVFITPTRVYSNG
jgi:PPOX class probable F420-dependent enzyme